MQLKKSNRLFWKQKNPISSCAKWPFCVKRKKSEQRKSSPFEESSKTIQLEWMRTIHSLNGNFHENTFERKSMIRWKQIHCLQSSELIITFELLLNQSKFITWANLFEGNCLSNCRKLIHCKDVVFAMNQLWNWNWNCNNHSK